MKTKKIWLSAATAMAVFTAAWLGAAPSMAQTDTLPEPVPTAVPLDAPVDVVAPAVRDVAPAAVQTVTWSPIHEYLRPGAGRNVTVTASSGIGLDLEYARFLMYNSIGGGVGALSATVAATSSISGFDTVTLTVTLPTTITFSSFSFVVKEAGIPTESRRYKVGFPTYVPATTTTFEWPPSNLDGIEPANDTPCTTAAGLKFEKTYEGTFKSIGDNDWHYIDVMTATNMLITATNVPVPSQMQVFASADGKCSSLVNSPISVTVGDKTAPAVTLSGLSGGRVYIRMVAVLPTETSQRYTLRASPNPTSGTFEDNDNPCQATPTIKGTTYTTQIDDTYDFFEMKVTQTGTLSMTVFNHANAGQFDLRSSLVNAACSPATSTQRLKFEYIYNDVANIQYFVTPGTYYARMYIASVPTTTKNYNFVWNLTPGSAPVAAAKVCIGDVTTKTCYGNAPGGNVPIWWEGLNGNAKITLRFTAMTGTKCPVPGKQPTMEFTTSSVNGNRTLSGADNIDWRLDAGAYKVVIEVRDATSGVGLPGGNAAGQAVKVDCEFRPAEVEQEPAP
jgi:hypothetical protein